MYAERRSSLLSRPGPLVAVIGVHVVIAYVLSVSMGVIEMPKILRIRRTSSSSRKRRKDS